MTIEERIHFLENSDERNFLLNLVEEMEEVGMSKDDIIDELIEGIVLAEANGLTPIEYIKECDRLGCKM